MLYSAPIFLLVVGVVVFVLSIKKAARSSPETEFWRGYTYAITSLNAGTETVRSLENYTDNPDKNQFDAGILAALRTHKPLTTEGNHEFR